jgi:hypothetical protein
MKEHEERKIIKTILIKSFWESRRGWQPQPIKKILTVVLYVILRAISQELNQRVLAARAKVMVN